MTPQQAGVSAERVLRTCLHCKKLPVQLGRAYCDECFHELLNGDCAAPGCKHEQAALATAPPEQAALEYANELIDDLLNNEHCSCLKGASHHPCPRCTVTIDEARKYLATCTVPDQPQATSAGALDDSFARIIKDLREAKATINGKPVMEIFASLNWMADRIEIALAAHDQKVRAEVLREAAELLDKWLNEKWVGAPADVIRSLAASAASKPAQAKES